MAIFSKPPLWRLATFLGVLLIVSVSTCQDRYRSTRWREPLYVSIYPIAADESPVTRDFVSGLNPEQFTSIDRFFSREAERYGLGMKEPVKTRLRAALVERPPQHDPRAGILSTVFWSLHLRYWAWRVSGHFSDPEDIRLFVLFHDPALTPAVPHSLGLTKGLLGVVYAYADPSMHETNCVVIAHELLHTLGATDKYRASDNAPRFPDGYGNPRQSPLYPQATAELMAGRRMLSANRWQQAYSLDEVVIGPGTALEIRWPQRMQ